MSAKGRLGDILDGIHTYQYCDIGWIQCNSVYFYLNLIFAYRPVRRVANYWCSPRSVCPQGFAYERHVSRGRCGLVWLSLCVRKWQIVMYIDEREEQNELVETGSFIAIPD